MTGLEFHGLAATIVVAYRLRRGWKANAIAVVDVLLGIILIAFWGVAL